MIALPTFSAAKVSSQLEEHNRVHHGSDATDRAQDKSLDGGFEICIGAQQLGGSEAPIPASFQLQMYRVFNSLHAGHPSERAILHDG